jgi:archaellum component FlaC
MNIEYDLKEILTDFKQEFAKINTKLDKLSDDVGELKISLVRVETELRGDIGKMEAQLSGKLNTLEPKLEGGLGKLGEKVDGIGKRVDTQEFVNRGVIVGLLVIVLGGFAKVFGFVPK